MMGHFPTENIMALKRQFTPNKAGIQALSNAKSRTFDLVVANRRRKQGAGDDKLRRGVLITNQRIANFKTDSGNNVTVRNGVLVAK
jgi:hypothetical protein